MKKISFIICLLTLIMSCNPVRENNIAHTNDDENSEELCKKLMAIWETGDTSLISEIFHIDSDYVDIPNKHVFKGISGAKDYISHVHNWGSDIKMEIRNLRTSGNMGYIEWTFTAIQSSPIKGRIPIGTNKKVKINGVTLIEIKNDQIIKATDYLDALGFVIQLGSRIELPGGVIIGENE